MDSKKTGAFIASIRKTKRLTQTELAELLQVTDKAISRWETGEGFPDVTLLPRLAEVLGVSVDEILEGGYLNKGKKSNDQAERTLKFFNQIGTLINLFAVILSIVIINLTYRSFWGIFTFVLILFIGVLIHLISVQLFFNKVTYTKEDKSLIKESRFQAVIKVIMAVIVYLPYVPVYDVTVDGILTFDSYLKSLIVTIPISMFVYLVGFYIFKNDKNLTKKFGYEMILMTTVLLVLILLGIQYNHNWHYATGALALLYIFGVIINYKNASWIISRFIMIVAIFFAGIAIRWDANGLQIDVLKLLIFYGVALLAYGINLVIPLFFKRKGNDSKLFKRIDIYMLALMVIVALIQTTLMDAGAIFFISLILFILLYFVFIKKEEQTSLLNNDL